MLSKWLNKKFNKSVIVFFNGWGMDERIVSDLDYGNNDVLTVFDYRDLKFEEIEFSGYERKILIAWSMGVYVCSYFYNMLKDFDRFIAVNGTQKPIDDEYGIPVDIYNLTVENFNELSCEKFMKKVTTEVNLKEYSARSIDELKSELISLRDLKIEKQLHFDKAIISRKDRIIPYKNQLNYWKQTKAKIEEKDGNHFIFNQYGSWDALL